MFAQLSWAYFSSYALNKLSFLQYYHGFFFLSTMTHNLSLRLYEDKIKMILPSILTRKLSLLFTTVCFFVSLLFSHKRNNRLVRTEPCVLRAKYKRKKQILEKDIFWYSNNMYSTECNEIVEPWMKKISGHMVAIGCFIK